MRITWKDRTVDLPGGAVTIEGLRALGCRLDEGTLGQLWRYCGAATRLMTCGPMDVLDRALSQRVVPALLASLPVEALSGLPALFEGLPRCLWMMEQDLPLPE